MKNKSAKIIDIIISLLIVVLIGIVAVEKHQDNKQKQLLSKCQEFAKVIESQSFKDYDYTVDVSEYNDGEHDKLHLMLNIFNYDETMQQDFDATIYNEIEKQFSQFDFKDSDIKEMRIDIFDAHKTETNGSEGIGVGFKEINK